VQKPSLELGEATLASPASTDHSGGLSPPGIWYCPSIIATPCLVSRPGDRPFRILIVEDFDDARELYCELFRFHGFEVHAAADGLTGLALAKTLLPDVMLLDLGLPKLDGLSVLSSVRSDDALARTPVVVLSAHAGIEDVGRAESLGANLALTKPYLPDDLVRVVWGLLKPRT
jgi:two-component system cell cycle response regulator DivK